MDADAVVADGSRAHLARFAARVLAFWFGFFTLVNVVGALRKPTFDENIWWVDLRFLPGILEQLVLALAGALLLGYGIRPARSGRRRAATLIAIGVLTLAAIGNTINFYLGWRRGDFDPGVPVPLSIFIAVLLALIGLAARKPAPSPQSRVRRLALFAVVSGAFVVGIPAVQMTFFGTTDYRRPADVIVVFGAKVHPGGVPSISLNDRMATAVELYRDGLAPTMIVSGATGDNGYNEADVMRGIAIDAGVAPDDIVYDPRGQTTQATADNTVPMFRDRGFERVLAVSHPYHLARIKLAYQGDGYDVLTVPSRTTSIPQLPGIIAREVPAFWLYYLRAVLS